MISQLLRSGLLLAAHGADADDARFIAFVVTVMAPVMIVLVLLAPKILRDRTRTYGNRR